MLDQAAASEENLLAKPEAVSQSIINPESSAVLNQAAASEENLLEKPEAVSQPTQSNVTSSRLEGLISMFGTRR